MSEESGPKRGRGLNLRVWGERGFRAQTRARARSQVARRSRRHCECADPRGPVSKWFASGYSARSLAPLGYSARSLAPLGYSARSLALGHSARSRVSRRGRPPAPCGGPGRASPRRGRSIFQKTILVFCAEICLFWIARGRVRPRREAPAAPAGARSSVSKRKRPAQRRGPVSNRGHPAPKTKRPSRPLGGAGG